MLNLGFQRSTTLPSQRRAEENRCQLELILTEYNQRNADKAEDSGSGYSKYSGPTATHWPPVHEQHADDVGRNLHGSRYERVDVDTAVQFSGVQRQRVVDETTRKPAPCRTA